MAGSFSAYLDAQLVEHVFGSGTFSKPALYLALTVSGTEVPTTGGTNYVRKPVAFTRTTNTASNTANVDFDLAGTHWGVVDGAAIYDAVSGGNLLANGTLSASKDVQAGDIFRAPASSVTASIT